jgi:hypothetical protein
MAVGTNDRSPSQSPLLRQPSDFVHRALCRSCHCRAVPPSMPMLRNANCCAGIRGSSLG